MREIKWLLVVCFVQPWDAVTLCWHYMSWGDKIKTKLNHAKNNDHLACCGFSQKKYSRFLWLVRTMNGCAAPSSQCLPSSKSSLTARRVGRSITPNHLNMLVLSLLSPFRKTSLSASSFQPYSAAIVQNTIFCEFMKTQRQRYQNSRFR